MKNIWVIANWKSNETIAEALEWISTVGPKLPKAPSIKVVVCPTFTALEEVKKEVVVNHWPLWVGAQDLSPFGEGPYTGEEPAPILKGLADLAILGHSERRKNFAETDEMVAEKVRRALESRIKPLVCVQDENTPVPVGVDLVAYEPVFAIGTGHPDSAENANQIALNLKKRLGGETEILYGGSVTSENAKPFLQAEGLNGLLVGGDSLNADDFLKIVEMAAVI